MENSPELKKTKQGLALLYEVSRAISSNVYLEEILSLVVGLTAELMESKICSLMLLDEQKQELVIKVTQSLSEKYRSKPPVKVGESVSGKAVKQKRPVIVNDVTKEADYRYKEIAEQEGLRSMISVPMMIKSRVVGVLNCYTSKVHSFSEEEVKILVGVANQSAVAIENTHLFAEKAAAEEALETRKKVERAKGIIMKKHGVSEEEAFRLLQKQSMNERYSLKAVADAVIVAHNLEKTKKV